MSRRNIRDQFKDGWNKLFGKDEDKTKLRTQSLFRSQQKDIKLNATHKNMSKFIKIFRNAIHLESGNDESLQHKDADQIFDIIKFGINEFSQVLMEKLAM